MVNLKKLLSILLIAYIIVLAVNLGGNYEYYAAGNDWHFSILFSLGITTLGCLGGLGIYVLFQKVFKDKTPRFNLFIAVLIGGLYGILLMLLVMKGMVWLMHSKEQSTTTILITAFTPRFFQ